jgi:hypothetical protein
MLKQIDVEDNFADPPYKQARTGVRTDANEA